MEEVQSGLMLMLREGGRLSGSNTVSEREKKFHTSEEEHADEYLMKMWLASRVVYLVMVLTAAACTYYIISNPILITNVFKEIYSCVRA